MGDRIAVMNNGILQQVDDPERIYRLPNNMFVATILGSPPMNFLRCSIKEENGNLLIQHKSFKLSTADSKCIDMVRSSAVTTAVVLGLRPEDITIHPDHPKEDSIPAEIYVTEPLGNETIVDIKLGDNVIKVLSEPDFAGKSGQRVWITINETKLHLFHDESHECIFYATDKSTFSIT